MCDMNSGLIATKLSSNSQIQPHKLVISSINRNTSIWPFHYISQTNHRHTRDYMANIQCDMWSMIQKYEHHYEEKTYYGTSKLRCYVPLIVRPGIYRLWLSRLNWMELMRSGGRWSFIAGWQLSGPSTGTRSTVRAAWKSWIRQWIWLPRLANTVYLPGSTSHTQTLICISVYCN